MTNLKPAQQLRSARLLAILTQAFAEYPRAHKILQAYSEGIGMDGSFQAVRGTSGFEALRLLAKEFSLRSRAEAAFFRSEFMSKTFKAQSGPTQISDLVRLHASGEGYTDYRTAALKFEQQQQRLFQELGAAWCSWVRKTSACLGRRC